MTFFSIILNLSPADHPEPTPKNAIEVANTITDFAKATRTPYNPGIADNTTTKTIPEEITPTIPIVIIIPTVHLK